MSDNTNINIGNLFGKIVNVPIIANDANTSPLYAISENMDNIEIKTLNRDDKWVEACKNSFNSPTNVRKIFISANCSLIVFYTPYIVNGKKSTEGCCRVRNDSTLEDSVNGLINFEKARYGDMAYNKIMPQAYKISGKPLSCLNSPWVLSNVEEVYIDTSCLFTEAMMSKIGFDKAYSMYHSKNVKLLEKAMPDIIETLSGINITHLLEQLSRLKVIGIIPELSSLIKQGIASKIADSGVFVYEANKNGIKLNESGCFYITDNAKNIDEGKIATRQYYKFDNLVLDQFAQEFYNKAQAERDKYRELLELERNKSELQKTDIEKTFDSLIESKGLPYALDMMNLTVARMDKDEKADLYNNLSKSGKENFGKILM